MCANCGNRLEGPFCGQCGQSSADLLRPAITLATDFVGDVFVWDGRFATTLRALITRPGGVARDFIDGRRQSFTPPIRLYLLATLFFFGLMALSDIRVVAITFMPSEAVIRAQDPETIQARRDALNDRLADLAARGIENPYLCGVMPGPDEIGPNGEIFMARDSGVVITLFGAGAPPSPRLFSPESLACQRAQANAAGIPSILENTVEQAQLNPAGFEAKVAASVGQTIILMVIAFALLNAILHPRRRLVEHIINSFYWHAAFLPGVAIALFIANLVPGNTVLMITTAAIAATGNFVFQVANDRGFYGSSYFGAILRSIPLFFGYIVAVAFLSLGLMIISAG